MEKSEQIQKYYSDFIHLSRYSRWLEEGNRRETWEETVKRLMNFWAKKLPLIHKTDINGVYIEDLPHTDPNPRNTVYGALYEAILNKEICPSMRSLMTAGPALDRDHIAGYNCSYTPITGTGKHLNIFTDEMMDLGFDEPISIQLKNPIVFDEIFYILLCGTGVGFSVERQYISNLPTVDKPLDRSIYRRNNKNYPGVPTHELSFFDKKTNTIRIADSKYGWASATRIIITELFNGNFDIKWDTSQIRPAGAKLNTFGGRASGPAALNDLFNFIVNLFTAASGRKLTSIEAHSLVCKIADTVVVGGVEA